MGGAAEMTAADRKKMKVQELRDELSDMGLDTTGTKAVLLERLEEALASAGGGGGDAGAAAEAGAHEEADKASGDAGADEELEDPTPGEDAVEDDKKASEIVKEDGEADVMEEEVMDPAVARQLAELEKRKARAEKFGVPFSEKDKAEMRRLKFGGGAKKGGAEKQQQQQKRKEPIQAAPVSEEEMIKRQKRMERFGLKRSGVEELALQAEAKRQAKKQAYVAHKSH